MIDTTYSTICSLLPYELTESKPGIFPNEYIIRKAPKSGIALTLITNSAHYLINPDLLSDSKEVRNIKVPVPAAELAQSIINDYNNGLLGVEVPDATPGLFTVQGNYTDAREFSLKFMVEIKDARTRQNNWFKNLVDIADDIWSKIKSPLSISDIQRFACESLELSREWQNPVLPETQNKCPYCQNVINFAAIKCLSCGEILDKKKYTELAGVK